MEVVSVLDDVGLFFDDEVMVEDLNEEIEDEFDVIFFLCMLLRSFFLLMVGVVMFYVFGLGFYGIIMFVCFLELVDVIIEVWWNFDDDWEVDVVGLDN